MELNQGVQLIFICCCNLQVCFHCLAYSLSFMSVVGTNYRVLIYCTCHFQGGSLCFSFFCFLVSSVSNFCPDTIGAVVNTFLGSLVQLCFGEGGTLQTNNTGVCSQCLSHTGPALAHSRSGSGTQVVFRGADSVGPAFCVLPRSEQLR